MCTLLLLLLTFCASRPLLVVVLVCKRACKELRNVAHEQAADERADDDHEDEEDEEDEEDDIGDKEDVDEEEEGEVDEENQQYESANDESNEALPPVNSLENNQLEVNNQPPSQVSMGNKLIQTVSADHQEPESRRNRHQLQLRSQPAVQYQRNTTATTAASNASDSTTTGNSSKLARGKQQRASISSCSSSDSYASYGSGYASGSGNSTDHERRGGAQAGPRQLAGSGQVDVPDAASSQQNKPTEAGGAAALTTAIGNLNLGGKLQRRRIASGGGGDEITAAGEDVPDCCANVDSAARLEGDGSRLRQHLSELEQLTDELARRDTGDSCAGDARSKSKSSSLLSTGSNISGLSSSGDLAASSPGSKQAAVELGARDSRSNSSTPKSLLQPQQQPQTPPPPKVVSYLARQQTFDNESGSNSNKQPATGKLAAPTAIRINSNGGPQALLRATPSKQQQQQQQPQQDSYYHNLFQWEQLVSKGVTRPLLINDLDFTDLRDDDDCDLLNSSANNGSPQKPRNQAQPAEPLTINIPLAQQAAAGQPQGAFANSADSGAGASSAGSPPQSDGGGGSGSRPNCSTPATAPPPLPPPPISPWFMSSTLASGSSISGGSRPQSQFMSSPSPTSGVGGLHSNSFEQYASAGGGQRDQSPAYQSSYNLSRNSICVPPGATASALQQQQFDANGNSTLQQQQPNGGLRSASSMSSLLFGNNNKWCGPGNKRKKTMKLFWKEVREDRSLLARLKRKKTIWDELKPVQVDTSRLEYLFESKAKELTLSRSRQGLDGNSQRKVKISVLDAKRSNAINIGMTKLPPMRTIKSAILKMDSSIMNREGIEKILTTMMPTEEEKSRIIEAQLANPDTPLGTAEQFLLNLASISALEARLKLWAFQLDYAQIEKEVAEPLMDLKQAIDEIERSETFRNILATLLSIGNFLNSTSAKGFQIDYLEKVPEVKDTVHKHSLLHHLCLFIQENFDPELTGDLYSEFSAVNRASKVDYTEVAKSLKKMQLDCKASWDHLKIVAKHDGLASLMNTCTSVNSSSSSNSSSVENSPSYKNSSSPLKSAGKLNNLSKLSMITTVIGSGSESSDRSSATANGASNNTNGDSSSSGGANGKQLKMKVSDFLTDCAERIMVLMVIHRRVMNRFQKLLVYLGCPLHQIKQTQPQQILKIINEFALEYRTKRERVRELMMRKQQCQHHHHHHVNGGAGHANRWQLNRLRWAGSSACIDALAYSPSNGRPNSTTSSSLNLNCPDCCNANGGTLSGSRRNLATGGAGGHRPGSPSALSQISNYSDFLLDQASCCSRQNSLTPVPLQHNGVGPRRPHSMSMSMMDLQNQQQQAGSRSANNSFNTSIDGATTHQHHNSSLDENELARQKDEELRRLLGAGKSLDEACNDLYQLSHWTSTMARVNRPAQHHHNNSQKQHQNLYNKRRAASLAPWSQRNVDM